MVLPSFQYKKALGNHARKVVDLMGMITKG